MAYASEHAFDNRFHDAPTMMQPMVMQPMFNIARMLGGIITVSLNTEMADVIKNVLDRIEVELLDSDPEIIRRFRECLDHPMTAEDLSFSSVILENKFPNGVAKTIMISMNYDARLALADYIADHDENDSNNPMASTLPPNIRAMINGLRYPGDKLTPRQQNLIKEKLQERLSSIFDIFGDMDQNEVVRRSDRRTRRSAHSSTSH